ncbi:MAG: hypothetical protein ACK55Z_30195 [bacterium]
MESNLDSSSAASSSRLFLFEIVCRIVLCWARIRAVSFLCLFSALRMSSVRTQPNLKSLMSTALPSGLRSSFSL